MSFRTTKSKGKLKTKPRQCVKYYLESIPTLISKLDKNITNKFKTLTPGYQSSWARYIFSATQEQIRQNRIVILVDALKMSITSIEEYRNHKKEKK